jgi:hypothetical protein
MARISDDGSGPEIFCCEWVAYPEPGRDTECSKCNSVFTLRPDSELATGEYNLPLPNFYPADGPQYRQAGTLMHQPGGTP